ncbi:Ig-like domain-containing protein [Chloroflexota bacterium]
MSDNPVVTFELQSIEIAPVAPSIPVGRSIYFTATGNYSHGNTENITGSATWTSSNTSVATIDSSGLAQSVAEGVTTIKATSGSVSDNTTLTVGPKVVDIINLSPENPEIAKGRSQQFTASGNYSDGSSGDITGSVTWTSSNTTVATTNQAGLASGLLEGQAVISANLSGVQNSTNLTVSAKVLDTLAVTPGTPSISAGRTQYFTATGTYSDASTANISGSVTWTSSNTSVARIYGNGLVRSYASGTTLITATSANCTDNTALTVGAAVLDSVRVTPANPSVTFISGNAPTTQFTATAVYSDGTSSIITGSAAWTSSNTTTATIGAASGLATTVTAGTTSINATYSGKTGNTTLTVLSDTVAPVVTLAAPRDGQIFSTTSVTVSGTVDDINATANVTINGGTTTGLTLDGSGNFSQSVTLSTGSNTILVRATDGSGNTGTSGTITVTVNAAKPGIMIVQPVSGLCTDNSSQTVSGTVTGNVSAVNLILNGTSQSLSVSGGNFTASVTLSERTNNIAVTAYTGGNEGNSDFMGTSGSILVTLDTTPPVVSVSSPVSGSLVSTATSTVSGTIDDPCVSTANLTLNSVSQSIPVAGGNFSQTVTLVSGSNTITVTATDEAGNTSPEETITIILDTSKPEVSITSPANGSTTNTSSQTVSGTVSDPSISSATLYLNGSSQSISVTGGSFSQAVTLASGANTIEVAAADSAIPANTGTSGNITVTLDNTNPTITFGLSDPTDSITIRVTASEALTAAPTVTINPAVAMEKSGVNKWTGTYGSSGSPIASGNYTVTAVGTDRAGNSATATATFCKQVVTISANGTTTVGTDTTTLEINTTANVTDASISVTQHIDNPSGNTGNPGTAALSAGVFIEIVASAELRDNLEGIYVTVNYDPNDLLASTDESTLKLYLWDVASGTWQVVAGSGVNTTGHYIYGTLTHLSKFGGFGTTTTTSPPAQQPVGGGGGGGGVPAGWTMLDNIVDNRGTFAYDATAVSFDKLCTIDIRRGTIGLDMREQPLGRISMVKAQWDPPAPEGRTIVGTVYEIGPEGTTFDTPITLNIYYDPDTLPENVSERGLYIAYWSKPEWISINATSIDREAHIVSGQTTHFTKFTLIGLPPSEVPEEEEPEKTPSTYTYTTSPAKFEISDLSVIPGGVKPGEEVAVSVVVTNTGGKRGGYDAVLLVNGTEEASKTVLLEAGQSDTVMFNLSRSRAGNYTIEIDGKTSSFSVTAPSIEILPPDENEETPERITGGTLNWGMIGGITGGLLVIAGLVYYFLFWKRRESA